MFLLALLCGPAQAQLPLLGVGGGTAAPTYTGPLDVVGSATTCWALRGCSASYSTGSNPGATVVRASDSTTQVINILSSGAFDITSANTFGGTDATCTATISSTTMAVTACASGTLHVNDQITGAGITNPTTITAIGTCASPPGTCTVSQAATVSVGETVVAAVALFVSKMNDQTGNGHDQVQATGADQPQLLSNCNGALPCLQVTAAAQVMSTSASITPASGVVTLSVVMNRAVGTGGNTATISENGTGGNRAFPHPGVANQVELVGGSSGGLTAVTMSDATWHAFNGLIAGASSVANVDGTETTGTTTGNTSAAASKFITGVASTTIQVEEGIIYDALTSTTTQRNNVCHNQRLYWSTAGSC